MRFRSRRHAATQRLRHRAHVVVVPQLHLPVDAIDRIHAPVTLNIYLVTRRRRRTFRSDGDANLRDSGGPRLIPQLRRSR